MSVLHRAPDWLAEADEAYTAYASVLVPSVMRKTSYGERGSDIFSRLLEDRIIFIGGSINDVVANLTVAQMLFLQSENKKQDIQLYIHSYGGSVTSGLAIYDTMQLVECDVATYVVGHAFSMAAVLLASGTKGKRYSLPHSRRHRHRGRGDGEAEAVDQRDTV